ncbi:MAG: hypothetical protein HKN61_09400 [Flavobacteriaceae bacterium]|nr:hypothetical protein [Flavobacteriaceae bacterium]
MKKAPVTFKLNGYPDAKKVSIAGSFNYWNPGSDYLERNGESWTIEILLPGGTVEYKFVVDGKWVVDPENPETIRKNGHTNSLLTVGNISLTPVTPQP